MKCREFVERATDLELNQIAAATDDELLADQRECAECTSWYEQRESLAAAIAALRNSTAKAEASQNVESAVLRAFRQSAAEIEGERPGRNWFGVDFGQWLTRTAYVAIA